MNWNVNVGRHLSDEARPCEQCGTMTALVINGYAYCPKHLDAGIRTVVQLEVMRVGAPDEVAEEATEWLAKTVRESNAAMQ